MGLSLLKKSLFLPEGCRPRFFAMQRPRFGGVYAPFVPKRHVLHPDVNIITSILSLDNTVTSYQQSFNLLVLINQGIIPVLEFG